MILNQTQQQYVDVYYNKWCSVQPTYILDEFLFLLGFMLIKECSVFWKGIPVCQVPAGLYKYLICIQTQE